MTTGIIQEQEKHLLALALEEQKWRYKKEELIFVEAGQHIRSLNITLWQVPSMAIAITGGLWYGTSLFDSDTVKIAALALASLVDLMTIVIIWRLRLLMSGYLRSQLSFQSLPDNNTKHVVMWSWSIILCSAAILGILGVCNVRTLSRDVATSTATSTRCENTVLNIATALKDVRSPIVATKIDSKNTVPLLCQ